MSACRHGTTEQDFGEAFDVELPAACAFREGLDAGVTSTPPHGVAGRSEKAGAIDGVADADGFEQLGAAWWNRNRQAAAG